MNEPSLNHPRKHGPWTIQSSREVYKDPWMGVRCDDVLRPDGQQGTYAIVDLKPGVCVVAVDNRGNVHLTEEFHYAVGRVTLEAVSGGVEPEHSSEETAYKELREELGITAQRLTPLGAVDPFTANVCSPTQLFLAEDLKFGQPSPEGSEVIQHVSMPLSDTVQAVLEGRITHGPSCVAILKTWLRNKQND